MTNVKLSASEIELAANTSIILTKNKIIENVYTLFGNLANYFHSKISSENILPANICSNSPKISKGENYENMPWVMLDYPKHFDKENYFAVRTFFLWGNFFSITLLVKGNGKTYVNEEKLLHLKDWFLCVNENEWHHHFRTDNYRALNTENFEKYSSNLAFLKVAKKFAINDWDKVDFLLKESFNELMGLLK